MKTPDPPPTPDTGAAPEVLGRLSSIDAAIHGGEHVVAHCRTRLAAPPGDGSLPPAERETVEGDLLAALARNAERQAQRRALLAALEPALRVAYDAIHRRGLRPAVAPFNGDGACPGCHLRVPPQRQVELRARGVLACPHCGRILYVAAGARPGAFGARRADRAAEHEA